MYICHKCKFSLERRVRYTEVRFHHPAQHISAKYTSKNFEIPFMYNVKTIWINGQEKKKHENKEMANFFKLTLPIKSKDWCSCATSCGDLGNFIPLHCCNFSCSIHTAVAGGFVQGSGCWDYLRKKEIKGEKLTALLSLPSPFSPTASINLCQLLPRAKPCLRETDLKGPIRSTAPLWGYCATTGSGRVR